MSQDQGFSSKYFPEAERRRRWDGFKKELSNFQAAPESTKSITMRCHEKVLTWWWNNSAPQVRKRLPNHRRAAQHDRAPWKTQYSSKHAAMASPERTPSGEKTRMFKRALLEILHFSRVAPQARICEMCACAARHGGRLVEMIL